MGREGAGRRAAITRRENRLRAIIAEQSAFYDTPGKRQVRDRLIALAVQSGCKTWACFWGGGTSARLAATAGLSVTSVERSRALHGALAFDAEQSGFTAFAGSARLLRERQDFWFADFMGPASRDTARELKVLSKMTDKWLAVTLAPDHQLDEVLTGPTAPATIAAWLMAVTGLVCEYIEKYVRNERGQWMWLAILRPADLVAKSLDPTVIVRTFQRRTWWARSGFRRDFAPIFGLPVTRVATDAVRKKAAEDLRKWRANLSPEARAAYVLRRRETHRQWVANNRERARELAILSHRRHREERLEKMRQYGQRPEVKARHAQRNREYRARLRAALEA